MLKSIAIILKTKKWDNRRLAVSKIIFWKFYLPPMVYASKNVFPCPGSKACKHPSIKIDVIVKDSDMY